MSAAVIPLQERRRTKQYGKPFVAVFMRNMLALDHTHHLSTADWRIMNWMVVSMEYGQRVPVSGATIARRLGYTQPTVYKSLKRLQQLGVLYKHRTQYDAPWEWYVSAQIGYRGKLCAWARVVQWEQTIKAANARGEQIDVELAAEHYYAGGVPDDDTADLPPWLEEG